jgi:FkbM family methyltransferase
MLRRLADRIEPGSAAVLKAAEPEVWADASVLDICFGSGANRADVQTIIDVGADVGSVTMGLHAFYPQATIYAFEPNPESCARLKANLGREPFATAVTQDRIRVFEIGLGDANGEADLHVLAHSSSSSMIAVSSDRLSVHPTLYREIKTVRVPVKTLDDFAAQNSIKAVDILKVDVEGFYPEVIRGGHKTLQTTRWVAMEIDFLTRDRSSAGWIEACDLLHEAGLSLTAIYGVSSDRRHGLSVQNAVSAANQRRRPGPMRTNVIDCLFERV